MNGAKRRAQRKADSGLTFKSRSVQLISPPPVANASPVDNVDLSDILLTLDESDRIFSDSESNEIKVVYEDLQDSDSDTVQYLPSPTYQLNGTLDVTTQRLTPCLSPGSATRSSSCCLTSELILSAYKDGRIATQTKLTKCLPLQ